MNAQGNNGRTYPNFNPLGKNLTSLELDTTVIAPGSLRPRTGHLARHIYRTFNASGTATHALTDIEESVRERTDA